MKKYKIQMTQYVTAQVIVDFEIESDKSLGEIEEEIGDAVEGWTRLARFDPGRGDLPGTYVQGTYKYDLDYQGDDGDEVEFSIEESDESDEISNN